MKCMKNEGVPYPIGFMLFLVVWVIGMTLVGAYALGSFDIQLSVALFAISTISALLFWEIRMG